MECFLFGLSVPSIQTRSSDVTRATMKLPVRTVVCVRRYKVKKKVPQVVPPVVKMQSPPVFSIELDNMFDILGI